MRRKLETQCCTFVTYTFMNRFNAVTFGILPVLDDLPQMPTPGLFRSTIYDVDAFPLPDGAAGDIPVNSSTYKVDCGLIQNITLGAASVRSLKGSLESPSRYLKESLGAPRLLPGPRQRKAVSEVR